MKKSKKDSRLSWSKLVVPPELADLFHMIARAKKYCREDSYLFLYHLLKETYPDDVEKLTDYLETRQYDKPPSEDCD